MRCAEYVLGTVFHVGLSAGCCDAPIQSSALQNNWPSMEQGSLFWQPVPAVSQHITLPLGGQKGAISASLDLGGGGPLFAKITLAKKKETWSGFITNMRASKSLVTHSLAWSALFLLLLELFPARIRQGSEYTLSRCQDHHKTNTRTANA